MNEDESHQVARSEARNVIHECIRRLRTASLEQRVMALLSATFSVLALVLAAVGIGGVVAHAVAQRTQEIGIRMTLGADAADVLRLVIRDGMLPVIAGMAAGGACAVGAAHALASQLFGVRATDPVTCVSAPLLLAAAALLACWLPARRATQGRSCDSSEA